MIKELCNMYAKTKENQGRKMKAVSLMAFLIKKGLEAQYLVLMTLLTFLACYIQKLLVIESKINLNDF